MAKKTVGHRVDRQGRVHLTDATLPRHLRGYDPEYDAHSFTEGPIKRLLSRRR